MIKKSNEFCKNLLYLLERPIVRALVTLEHKLLAPLSNLEFTYVFWCAESKFTGYED